MAAALTAGSGTAAAQDKPQDSPQQPTEPTLPRGPGGAILKPPDRPNDTPTPGKAQPPRPLNYAPPEFPAEAEKEGIERATVILQLDVDKTGKLTRAIVVNPAGHGFDEAALAAAKKLEFAPATRADGTAVAASFLYRYTFELKPAEPTGPTGAPTKPVSPVLRGRVLFVPEAAAGATASDAAIAGALVTITGPNGTTTTVTTNDSGDFSVTLPAGTWTVSVAAPGFEGLRVDEELEEGKATEVKYRLLVEGSGLEITVRGQRPPREVVRRTLEQREISRIPGTNGDALRSIQSLPGVARPPGLAGLLIVRGSAPQDTQTFIDGTPVPLIYHFGGLSSVVPTEIVEKIDFYPGNFSTQYGRVMGGIVDAGIREPKNDGSYHGLLQVDLIDARALFEGPVPFFKNWQFLVAGRRSYVDAWLGPVLESAGAGVTQAPVYYDYQAMVATKPSSDSTFRLTFFGSDDALELLLKEPAPGEPGLSGNIGLHTAFQRVQGRLEASLGPRTQFAAVAALGRDVIDAGAGGLFNFVLDFKSVTGRLELSQRVHSGVTVNVGADLLFGVYDVFFQAPAPPVPGQPPNGPFSTRAQRREQFNGTAFVPGTYVEAEIAPNARSKIVPGVRFDYSDKLTDRIDVSPRVNARYDVIPGFPKTTAKAGFGIFHQPPQFQEALPPIGTPGLRPNRAIHYALGAEQQLTRQIDVSLEGFYKQLDDLVTGRATASGIDLEYDNSGRGYAVGGEVLLKYKPDERFFGWLAYTLSRSARTDPGYPERLAQFDQTHILTVLGSYQLGHGWEFGARFRLISGNLTTPNVCNAEDENCDAARTNALFHAPSGVYTPIPFGDFNSERLPLFHQLDVRLDKRWKFKAWQLSAYLDVQNVYNRANAEAIQYNYNFTARQYVTGLPILPSLGLRGEF